MEDDIGTDVLRELFLTAARGVAGEDAWSVALESQVLGAVGMLANQFAIVLAHPVESPWQSQNATRRLERRRRGRARTRPEPELEQ